LGGRTASLGRRALAATLNATGEALAFSGWLMRARQCLQCSVSIIGSDRSLVLFRAATLNRLGVMEKTAGQYDGADCHYREAAALMETAGPLPLHFVAAMEHNRAGLALARGDSKAAETHARRAVTARRRAGASESAIAIDQVIVSAALAGQDRIEAARTQLREALSTLECLLGPNHYEVGSCLIVLGALEQQDDPHLARQYYERALIIKKRTRGSRHPEVGIVHNNLGVLALAQGCHELAVDHFRTADRLLRRFGPDHPATRICQANIVRLRDNEATTRKPTALARNRSGRRTLTYANTLSELLPVVSSLRERVDRVCDDGSEAAFGWPEQ
jgi:tetratricopeptide (TPR) repeat protein